MDSTDYDAVHAEYARYRKPDVRIAALIENALGDARSVINVGAGTGSYEPASVSVVAVDASLEMLKHREARRRGGAGDRRATAVSRRRL
ncbi:hypothetical protein [uncultured Abyssibacter sp.]|uniref:hypothetical protein n=1 Tax=uncultured Abyssibacter sp. TaxID=2320202 RepID=UPI0032B18C83